MTEEADVGSVTSLLKRTDPLWWWLRENFKLPSLLTIGGLLVSGGAWLWTEHAALRDLQGRVAAIKVGALDARLNTLELHQAVLAPRLNEFDRRIGAQEHEWQVVHDAALRRVPGVSQSGRPPNRPGR